MFLPNEAMYSAALQVQPTLIEEGVAKKVLIATPTTLIALLLTAHYGWHQERLAENAQAISEQGRELHSRLASMFDHWSKVGAALGKATDSYNQAVGSFERKVRPAVRKLEDMGAGSEKSVVVLEPIEARPRVLTTEEAPPPSLPGDGD
jgi:DNA recombination protein RmuC